MSRNTIAKYLAALSRLFITNNQEPYSPNFRSGLRIKQSEKRHFSDPSMAAALLSMTEKKLFSDLNTFGFLFESLADRDLGIYAQSFGGNEFYRFTFTQVGVAGDHNTLDVAVDFVSVDC